ncbi:hypothetical protein niasHT_032994 [Heterodera trifolii]|uniref:Uncharacterized protein n=1 Tax=Heterodera trifolii TaxID=157864 RepID=A0ABD2IG92_9BILA
MRMSQIRRTFVCCRKFLEIASPKFQKHPARIQCGKIAPKYVKADDSKSESRHRDQIEGRLDEWNQKTHYKLGAGTEKPVPTFLTDTCSSKKRQFCETTLCGFLLSFTTPLGCALFPQFSPVKLEPELQEQIRQKFVATNVPVPELVYYNKGL